MSSERQIGSCQTKTQHLIHMAGWWTCGIISCFGCSNGCGSYSSEIQQQGCCCVWSDHNAKCRFGKPAVIAETKRVEEKKERSKVDKNVDEINLSMKHIIA
jgi:hypothetical protein